MDANLINIFYLINWVLVIGKTNTTRSEFPFCRIKVFKKLIIIFINNYLIKHIKSPKLGKIL